MELLKQRASDALGDPAYHLAPDDLGVDGRPAVVGHDVFEHPDLPGPDVHGDDGHMAGVRVGGGRVDPAVLVRNVFDARRVVGGGCLQAGFNTFGEIDGPDVGGRRHLSPGHRRSGAAPDGEPPVEGLDVLRGGLQQVGRDPDRFGAESAGSLPQRPRGDVVLRLPQLPSP